MRARADCGLPSRYIFDDKSKLPFMTYSQLQFVKAEAAFRGGDKATALTAYRNAVSAHIDFVNARNAETTSSRPRRSRPPRRPRSSAIARMMPTDPSKLTLTHDHVAEVHRAVGVGPQRAVDGHAPLSLHRPRSGHRSADLSRASRRRHEFCIRTTTARSCSASGRGTTRSTCGTSRRSHAISALALDYHTKPLWITQP